MAVPFFSASKMMFLDYLDDSVVGELLLVLLHDFEALLDQLVLDEAFLVVQVLINLVVDLYQEVDSLLGHFLVLTLQSHTPHQVQLIQIGWVRDQLEHWNLLIGFRLGLVGPSHVEGWLEVAPEPIEVVLSELTLRCLVLVL